MATSQLPQETDRGPRVETLRDGAPTLSPSNLSDNSTPGMRLDQLVNSATHRSKRETDEFGENESDYTFSDQKTNSQLDHTTYEGERRLSDEHGNDRQWHGS